MPQRSSISVSVQAAEVRPAVMPAIPASPPTASVAWAQADMRHAYCSGGPGILASALAWTAATVAALATSPQRAVWVLLIGGALIHPAGVLVCRLLGAPVRHATGNVLAPLAAASTAWLIFCLPLAYVVGLQDPAWFFSAMLLVIGGRYLVLATVFGVRLYWALGLTLAGAGVASTWLGGSAVLVAAGGAAAEWAFGAVCLARHRAQQGACVETFDSDEPCASPGMPPRTLPAVGGKHHPGRREPSAG